MSMFVCPYCGCKESKVTDTRQHDVTWKGIHTKIIRRRRVCRYCGVSYNTTERLENEDEIQRTSGGFLKNPAVVDLEERKELDKQDQDNLPDMNNPFV